jgi:proline iminopeptidase
MIMVRRNWFVVLVGFLALALASCSPNNDSVKERENLLLLTYLSIAPSTGFVTSADGTKIFYEKVGTGTPVVVLHGGPGLDHNYLVEPLKNTIGAGRQLIFFDQRGTGYSEGSFSQINASFINKTKFLEDLDAIRTQLSLGDKINILGHSWGGLYATDATYKSHVKSLALVASAGAQHGYYGTFTSNLINGAGGLIDIANIRVALSTVQDPLDPSTSSYAPSLKALKNYYAFLFKYYFADFTSTPTPLTGTSANFSLLNLNSSTEKSIRNGIAVGNLINDSLKIDYKEYSSTLTAGTSTLDIRAALAGITVPVMLIHGASDVMPKGYIINTGASDLNSVETALTGVVETKVSIANCGHFPFIEKPTEFTAALSGFFL